YITIDEKRTLAREKGVIDSNHSILVSQAENWGITEQTGYLNYLTAYNNLNEYLAIILDDMTIGSTIESAEEMQSLFSSVYSGSSSMEEQFFQLNTGLVSGIDTRGKFELDLQCSSGPTVSIDNIPSTISAMLLLEGVEVTDEYLDSEFTWERVSEDRTADAEWRGGSVQGKSISISASDLVFKHASFLCTWKHFYSDTMFYTKTTSIAVAEEIPGEAAYQTEVISQNGTVFRMGDGFVTVLEVRVWQGGEEITEEFTDADFRWRRKSEDSYADSVWNSAHYSTGGKTITITQDDAIGRCAFFCDLLSKRS
ncbi:MAG: hypothetical protein JXK93_06175, partial [Sphaerochaetaceae bacterium]|nr:hypothetical protein [Sphaerochaetaceae bacterium]